MTNEDDLETSPTPDDAPRKPVRLIDMTYYLQIEAERIRTVQERYIRDTMRGQPSRQELERAEVFEATARFLDRIRPVLGQVLELIRRAEQPPTPRKGSKVDGGSARKVQ